MNDEKHESGEDDSFGLTKRKIAKKSPAKTRFVRAFYETREPRALRAREMSQQNCFQVDIYYET